MNNIKKSSEDWMNRKWRPMMGWTYMATCIADFIIFPILWSILQAFLKQPVSPWQPLTIQGAGLYHVAMGAVLGIAAFGRTQEKISGTTVSSTFFPTSQTSYMATASSRRPVFMDNTTMVDGKKSPPSAFEPLI